MSTPGIPVKVRRPSAPLPITHDGNKTLPWVTNPSTNGAWWMPLLEKAYAKLHLNYDRIVGGSGAEGLRTLTGMPVVDINHYHGWYTDD
jgi:hypothetical protein